MTHDLWLMLYGNAAALQIGLYIWNRRHNVSPHEPEGSGGVAGMVMSALSAPIYVQALKQALLRQEPGSSSPPRGQCPATTSASSGGTWSGGCCSSAG